MSVLSMTQIAQLAASVGFQGSDLATAVAIAMVESGGNPDAQNPNEPSYGLWQIDTQFHPSFSPQQLLDPQQNAKAAYQVFLESGSSFRQWTGSYTNGKYLAFLPQATATVAALFPPPPPSDQITVIPPEPSSSDITNGTTPQTDGGTVATASGAIAAVVGISLLALWALGWDRG